MVDIVIIIKVTQELKIGGYYEAKFNHILC